MGTSSGGVASSAGYAQPLFEALGTTSYADEFRAESGTTPSGWSLVADTSPTVTWAEKLDVVVADHPGGDSTAEMHALVRALPQGAAAGAFTIQTAFRFMAHTQYIFAGLLLADGATYNSGKQVKAGLYDNGGDNTLIFNAHESYNTETTVHGQLAVTPINQIVHVRILWSAANTWQCQYSFDGFYWRQPFSNYSYTMTPTHMGLWVSTWNTGTTRMVPFEYFRAYNTLTP